MKPDSIALFSAIVAMVQSFPADSRAQQSEWQLIVQSYRELEWIAGLSGESADNGNEWNFAEGKPATEAELSEPHSAMADLAGNIYVADKNAHAIRKIAPDGILTTVAGTNQQGFNGDGVATECQLDGPQHAYPLPDGTFYVLDSGNRRIRRVGANGEMVTRIVESEELSRGLWVSRDENIIYYATATALKKWTPDQGSGPAVTLASGFKDLANLDVAANGDIYVSDREGSRVYRVPPTNTPAIPPVPVAGVGGDEGDGPRASGNSALSIGMKEARGVAFHPLGGYFVATHKGGDVWYVDTTGTAWMFIEGDADTTFFSSPQPVPTTRQVMAEPRSVSVALNGDILICGNDAGYIRRVPYAGPPAPPTADFSISNTPAGGLTLRWQANAARWFCIESADRPGAPEWSPELIGPCTGELQEWAVAAPSGGDRRFYRLKEFRAWPN